MHPPILHSRLLWCASCAFLSFASALPAAVYTENFDLFPNGTTNVGNGTIIASRVAGGATVQSGKLELTRDGVNDENGTFKIPGFAGAANGWTAEFDVTITDADPGANPADGVSFNWGNFPLDASLSANVGGAEHGWTQTFNHIAFQVDTYNINAGDNGVRIAAYPSGGEFLHAQNVGNILLDNSTVTGHVIVSWNPVDGASMTTTGFLTNANFSGINIPGLVASDSNVFAFASRTGGANESVRIDNFVLSATPGVGISTPNLAISELLIDNTTHDDEHGQTPGWVELYNGTPNAISLNGWSLTDDPGQPAKWTFPNGITVNSYTHLLVYFGHGNPVPTAPDTRLHATFQPAKAGGYLGLYQGAAEVDALNTYPQQFEDVSYGRLGAAWTLGFLETPTPGIRNSGTQSPGGPSQGEVAFSQEGGLVTGPFALTLSFAPLPVPQPGPGAVIRYTTNNTAPTPSSPQYTVPLNITNSTIVRARIFEPDHLPGDITSRGYISLAANLTNYRGTGSFNSNLPVLVFDSFGINIDGAGGTPGLRPFRSTFSVVVAPDPNRGNRAILDAAANIDFQGRCGTHLRGETSAGFPQKPYAWELWDNQDGDKDASILGMPADSDWVLLSNFNDKALVRNILPYQTYRDAAGAAASGRTMYVEVFFNQVAGSNLGWEDYRGVYILTEKIKRGDQRVDIAGLEPTDGVFTNNPAVDDASVISGGYIVRRDKASPEPNFNTTNWNLQIVEPSAPSTAQISYIQNYMNRFEASLNTPADPVNNFYRYADVDSFIYNAWWVEIFKQIDGYRLSTYFYKDRGEKVRAFPLWDYNLSLGNANYNAGMDPAGWYFNSGGGGIEYTYWQKMFAHAPTSVRRWDLYWNHRRGIFENNTILSRIDSMVAQLRDNLPGTSDIWNGVGTAWANGTGEGNVVSGNLFPNAVPNVECPAGRQNARYQRIGFYNWPNADGFGTRNRYDSPMTAASALALTGTAANEYGLETVTSDVAHTKAWLIKRLDWIDNARFAGTTNTILRPPVFSHAGGSVTAPHSLTITPYTGTAPAATLYGKSGTLNYATGPIYYTTDGSDPILPPTSAVWGTPRPFVLDNNACEVVLPTSVSTTGETDASSKNWKDWDFNGATANPVWKSGLNGVGFDNSLTVSFYPYINMFMGTSANIAVGASPTPPVVYGSTMFNVNQTCYIRLPFTLTAADLDNLTGLRLYGRVDDGFVAYLNGVRISDVNAPATLTWNTGTVNGLADADGLLYKEYSTYNVVSALAALRAGTNVLAIHALNGGIGSSDLLMRFKLEGDVGGTPGTPGGISPVAQVYSGPVTINSSTTIRARQVDTATGEATSIAEATFVVDTVPASSSNIVVSEIMYNPSTPTVAEVGAGYNNDNMFEYLEVMNIGSTAVDMSGVVFSTSFNFSWPTTDPNLRVLPPGGRAVIVGHADAFNFRYAPDPGVKIVGVMDGNISNQGERVVLTGPGGTIKDFTYDTDPPWPKEPDNGGYSLVLNNPAANPDHNLAINWRSSYELNGTPGTAAGPVGPSAATALLDDDGDGFNKLMEHASGTSDSDAGSQHWPAAGRMIYTPPLGTAAEHLTFSYRLGRAADGNSIEPLVGTELTAWQPLSTQFTLVSQTNNPDGTATILWRSTNPASALPGRLFLKLQVTLNP
jgi:hypothetical protein